MKIQWNLKGRLLPIIILMVLIVGYFLDKMVITPRDEKVNSEQFASIYKISLRDRITAVESRSHGFKTALKMAGSPNDWKVFHVEADSNLLYFERLAVPGDSIFKEANTNLLRLQKGSNSYTFLITGLGEE